jgi:hypothetical protein
LHHDAGSGGRGARGKRESRIVDGLHFANGPTSETTRQFFNIELGVAIVGSPRVKLENFARVVFVRRILLIQNVVEIDEHGRTGRAVEQQVPEISKGMVVEEFVLLPLHGGGLRPGLQLHEVLVHSRIDQSLKGRRTLDGVCHFVVVGGEMIFPKLGENGLELLLRVNSAHVKKVLEFLDPLDCGKGHRGKVDNLWNRGGVRTGQAPVVKLHCESVGALYQEALEGREIPFELEGAIVDIAARTTGRIPLNLAPLALELELSHRLRDGSLQGRNLFHVLGVVDFGERFFCALHRFLDLGLIDLGVTDSEVGEDGDLFLGHFHKTRADGEFFNLTIYGVTQLTGFDAGHQRHVPGQNAQLPFRSRQVDIIDLTREEFFLGGNNIERQWHAGGQLVI